jgi:hypothetical protein
MSRELTSAAQAQASAQYHTLILLGKLEFDDPVYVHTGIGHITFDGNTYIGVGNFAGVDEARESAKLGPLALDLTLAAPDPSMLAESLDSGNYGDPVTIYAAYRLDDGSIVDDPWVVWSGWFEFASIVVGNNNAITVTVQHDLSVLEEVGGARFTDEDQQRRYTGDRGFEFVHLPAGQRLQWGGRVIGFGRVPGHDDGTPPPGNQVN